MALSIGLDWRFPSARAHEDLVGLFGCAKCKAVGRERRPVFFTCIPDYEGQQRQRNRD